MKDRPFVYCYEVRMMGFEPVEGELLARTKTEAEEQAVLLFEQTNDIDPVGTRQERVDFYGPKVTLLSIREPNTDAWKTFVVNASAKAPSKRTEAEQYAIVQCCNLWNSQST